MGSLPIAGSRHFSLHSLAEGTLAAIATDGGAAICNAGVVDLGGRVLVFDTFLTPQAAADLRQAIADWLGATPCTVVNSHYHNDHIWGNQAFPPEVAIVSSRRTRELIKTAGAEELAWYSANSAQRLEAVRAQYEAADDDQRSELELWIGYYEGLVEALPRLTVRLPDLTFDRSLEVSGGRSVAELIAFEGGHSGHDAILHVPGPGIVFAGDLLFVDCHPYLGDGDPLQLLSALQELGRLQATCYIPGHGPAGTARDVDLEIAYVEHCLETAHALVAGGFDSDNPITELKIPEEFAHWRASTFYEQNIRFLCTRLRSEAGE